MASPKYQVYGLEETYPELGAYTFKIVLNPRFYKSGVDFDVTVFDSDRKPMKFDLKKWGRKLNVTFFIEPTVADGVSFAVISKSGNEVGRLSWWVIKP